ncbi:MAG: hypothetical protein JWQ43_3325, partial [Glaciihabitans sp.]|nr:hypothetical protein [Glaciihabitans sp.]
KVSVQHSGSVTAKSTGAVEWSSGKPVITAQAKTTAGVSVAGVIRVYDGTTLLGTGTAKTGVNGGTVSIALTKSLGVGSHTLRVVHESKNVEETTVKQVITKTTTTLGVSQKAIAATTKSASNTRFTVTARTKNGAVSAGTILVREKGAVVATLYPKAANNGTVTFTPPKPTAGNHTYSFSFGATSTSNAATKNAAATFTAAKSVTSVSGSVVQSGGKTYITVKLVNKAGKALDGEVAVTKNKAAAPKLVLNSSNKRVGTIAVGATKGTFTYVIRYAGTASTAGSSKTVVVKVS